MTLAKSVLGIVPGLQATALVGENLKALNFKKNGKDFGLKKMTNLGIKNMVGVALIKPTASMINTL